MRKGKVDGCMVTTKIIFLTDLNVNTENSRFDPLTSQKEAIDKMIENQGDKLYNLAKDIAQYGLNPNVRAQVTAIDKDATKFIVLEGNRRIVTLKLMANPDIIDTPVRSTLKKKFQNLHNKIKDNLIDKVECNYYADPKDAEHWIGIKHGYGPQGVSTVKWDAWQKTRYEESIGGKSKIVFQTIKLLKDSPYISKKIKNDIPNIKLTNLHRLVSDPSVRDFLGLEYSKGILKSKIDEKELMKGLAKVVEDCANPKFTVNDIYTKKIRKDYIDSFPAESTPNKDKKIDGKSTSAKSKKTRKKAPYRTKLIPGSCKLSVSNPKINSIYDELQKLNIETYQNAVSVLFRVFIELSLDTFLENKKMIEGVSAAKERLTLNKKLIKVLGYLTDKGFIDATISKGIRVAVSNKDHLLGIDTWHAYVHSNQFSATPKDLITTWGNIQIFVEKVWENIK